LFEREFELAAETLMPLRQYAEKNPLVYHDLVSALVYSEKWYDAVQIHEQLGDPGLSEAFANLFADLIALS